MKNETNDYAADVEMATATPQQLEHVLQLCRRKLRLENEIIRETAALEEKAEQLKKLSEADLPTAMQEANLTVMSLGGGYEVRVITTPFASIKREEMGPAITWLDGHGHGDIVKHEVKILFPREQEAFFKKFMRDLAKRKRPVDAGLKEYVDHQTLNAFVREQLAAGVELPRETFGIFEKTVATLQRPKQEGNR